ncbi:MAG: hypothetical protein J7K63_00890 [Candidatus Marinimicrobia bacterium]|nr:hypothetical protein [Candidatus Neomarinimicrobiota bacterium]
MLIRKMKYIILVGLIMINGSVYGMDNIYISGYARNYTGMLLEGDRDFSIIQNTLDLNFEKKSMKGGLLVNPYLYHTFDSNLEIGLREAYLDLFFDNFDLRIGKQQIIQGKAEGAFITDVVSPKDLQEFLLPDFDEIRMGVTAFKINAYHGNSTYEAVWVPVFTPTRMPDATSIWNPGMDYPVQPVFDYSTSDVPARLENSEAFIRYSTLTSRFDLELVGGYMFYDDPVMHMTKEFNPVTQQLTGLTVRPEYHRVTLGGGSVSLPVGSIILRGESGFYSGRYFQIESPAYPDATVKKNFLHSMAGLDFNVRGIIFSSQIIQEYILDYESGILNDEFDHTLTFLAKKDFLQEKLWLELFIYTGLNEGDALIRPKISYSFTDGFDILLGSNIFAGDAGRFGRFDDNDMIYAKIKYYF